MILPALLFGPLVVYLLGVLVRMWWRLPSEPDPWRRLEHWRVLNFFAAVAASFAYLIWRQR